MAGPAVRPTGITILAILSAIGGVLGLFAGLAAIGLGGFVGAVTGSGALGGLLGLIGLAVVALSIVELVLAYGFWNLLPWAWQVGVVLQIASIVLAVLQFLAGASLGSEIVSILIAGAILWYLNSPAIRTVFGRPATGF